MFLYIFKFTYLNTYMSFKLKFFLRVSNDLEKRKKWHQEIFLIKSFLKKNTLYGVEINLYHS